MRVKQIIDNWDHMLTPKMYHTTLPMWGKKFISVIFLLLTFSSGKMINRTCWKSNHTILIIGITPNHTFVKLLDCKLLTELLRFRLSIYTIFINNKYLMKNWFTCYGLKDAPNRFKFDVLVFSCWPYCL